MKYFRNSAYVNLRREPNGDVIDVVRKNTLVYSIGEPRWVNDILWANVITYGFSGEWATGYMGVGLEGEIFLDDWEPHVKLGSPYKSPVVYLTQMYGENPGIYSRFGYNGHNGVDLVGVKKQIYAVAPGVATVGYDANGYGHYVKIEGYSLITIYAHLAEYTVRQDQYVQQGELIGHEGNSGGESWGMGVHLHLDIRNKLDYNASNGYGGRVDPLPYLDWSNIQFPTYVNVLNF